MLAKSSMFLVVPAVIKSAAGLIIATNENVFHKICLLVVTMASALRCM